MSRSRPAGVLASTTPALDGRERAPRSRETP